MDSSHFAIPDGFAKSQTSNALQECFQNGSVIINQLNPLRLMRPK